MKIIESLDMIDIYEDWSRVRSPSRAARRRRQGHKQNIIIRGTPKKYGIKLENGDVMVHPLFAARLRTLQQMTQSPTFSDAFYYGLIAPGDFE